MLLPDIYRPDLQIKDRVKLVRLGGDQMENMEGTLVGISSQTLLYHWIVEFDEWTYIPAYGFGVKCVTIPSVCLEKVA